MATKVTVTSTVDSVPDDSPPMESGIQRPERRVTAANIAILAGVLLPCIPIIVVSGALLGLLFYHRIDLNPGFADLRIPEAELAQDNITDWISLIRKQGGEWAYYVEYNPSTLTTVASWTSRILPWCASSIMALVAFYAARHIVLKSNRGDGSDLPNPRQLTILINVLEGSSWGPIKDTVRHRYTTKEPLAAPLPASVLALFAITLLGIIIPILDSWFGIATTAPTVTQLYPRASQLSFGRKVGGNNCDGGPRLPNGNTCLRKAYVDTFWPCNVANWECYPVASLYGIADASKTNQGVSTVDKVWNYTDSSSGDVYYYLGSPNQNALVDFKAHTFAMQTQCKPMTQKCYKYDPDDYSAANAALANSYNCTGAFHGSLYSDVLGDSTLYAYPNVGVAFARDPELEVAGDLVWGPSADMAAYRQVYSFPQVYATNPFHFGAWATGYPPADPTTALANPFGDGDKGVFWTASIDAGGGATWQLNCSSTVYDVSYSWIDGAVHAFNRTESTPDTAALFGSPFAYAANLSAVPLALAAAAQSASTADSSKALADTFASELSKSMLAYGVGALEPALNVLEQGRNSTVRVARVPMVPLYLLLATKFVFVVVVLVLAVGVYCFSHPHETEAVRAALSAKGLAAAHFQSPGAVQANVVREVQSRLESVRGEANGNGAAVEKPPLEGTGKGEADGESRPKLRHANTAPVQGSAPAPEPKVGLLPAADGTWQFVMVANGVWQSIKPIVKQIVVSDAAGGGLGDVGKVISAWK